MIRTVIPLGIHPLLDTASAASARYHLLTHMTSLTGGRGFRMQGTKRGVTKRPYQTRTQRIAAKLMEN